MDDPSSTAGEAFAELCRLMARLRGPQGCPWDRQQTLASLKPYLLEETYETLDAIDAGEPEAHREELGDLLLQVVFQAQIRHEQGHFDAAAVARAITDKLWRRHPHVFGDAQASDADGALATWEAQKAAERAAGQSALDSIPRALPALLRAQRTGEKAAAVGFDWQSAAEVLPKVDEELAELRQAMRRGHAREIEEELGDLLFAIVNLARHLHLDAESALHKATEKFGKRFRQVERGLRERQRSGMQTTLDQLEALWEEAKAHSKDDGSA